MHRIRRFSAVLVASSILIAPGYALAIRPRARTVTPELQVAAGPPTRLARTLSWNRVPSRALPAWSAFLFEAGTGWQSAWDHATGVPSQIFGKGIPAALTVESAAAAAAFSRAFLAQHVALLAPGDAASDFRLVSNEVTGDNTRVVGFFQYYRGMRVIGGQVSFRFKNDRLFVIASEALPHVDVPAPLAMVSSPDARNGAAKWLSTQASTVQPGAVDGPYVLPIVGRDRIIGYRTVIRVDIAAQDPIGRWDVYVDAGTGKPVARRQRLQFGTAEVRYNAPDRWPGGSRSDYQARDADSTVDGATSETDGDGVVSWSGDSSAQIIEFARGPLAVVHNEAGDDALNKDHVLPNGISVWDGRSDEFVDAQIDTFVHIGVAKAFASTFAPRLSWLDQKLTANVNINDVCNAYYDGTSINFFASSKDCGNTGRIADVVYHEFGHGVHDHSIIPGVGAFDGAFAEGQADFFAAMITNDPGIARGFFRSDKPLRNIDPPDKEYKWPDDIGEIHHTGLIFSGAMWDLRKLLIAKYGYARGAALTAHLYYAAIQRSVDIPSSYVEVLAADDDDGDLSNGTPDVCAINQAFGRHGLRSVGADVAGPGSALPNDTGYPITLQPKGLFNRCAGERVSSATLSWRLPGSPADIQSAAMTPSGGTFQGIVPPQPSGVVEYQVNVTFADGTTATFPQNRADPWFEFYIGKLVKLYCTNFATNPFTHGWTHGLSDVQGAAGVDDWQWGPPTGGSGSGDPTSAHSGDNVIGNGLGIGGMSVLYQPNSDNFAESPAVDIGHYSDVHLQYWRQLNVEDGYFDQARIFANDQIVWQNLNSHSSSTGSTNHRDHQWRFEDVPLSKSITGHKLQVKFELSSDSGLEFGGWTIDDFCIVANPASICGDGVVSGAEQCDNGAANSDTKPNACRTNCQKAHCGDGVVDKGEACDDGNQDNNDGCTTLCQPSVPDPPRASCTCRVGETSTPGPGALFLLGVVVFGIARRRRRRAG